MKGRTGLFGRFAVGRALCVLTSAILLANSMAPAVAGTLQNRRDHVLKPGPKVPVMKGVPVMDLSKQGVLRHAAAHAHISRLDDQAKLAKPVRPADIAAWHQAAERPGKSSAKADGLIWLGEYSLAGRQEPVEATAYFDRALAAAPKSSPEHGVAAFDHALASLFRGAYAQAAGELGHILRAKPAGIDPKHVALVLADGRACAGYHQQHSLLGITEPKEVDPLCAVASLAVCLREVGLPHDKKLVAIRSCQ